MGEKGFEGLGVQWSSDLWAWRQMWRSSSI